MTTPSARRCSSRSGPPAQILELNRWIKDYASKNGCIYLDYFSAMVDDKGLLKRDLADDGLHPNDKGFAIMAPLAQKAIDQALAHTDWNCTLVT